MSNTDIKRQKTVDGYFQTPRKNSYVKFWKEHILDGTSSFVEAEALILRQLSHDFEIYDILVYVAILKDSPNAEIFEEVIEHVVCSVYNKRFVDLRGSMMDRASVNKNALKVLQFIVKIKFHLYPMLTTYY